MKLTRYFGIILSLVLVCVISFGLLQLTTEKSLTSLRPLTFLVSRGSDVSKELSPDIPANPVASEDRFNVFGDFAWQTFVALNWPADPNGNPLKDVKNGDPYNEKPHNEKPRVWEFYNYPENVFQHHGANPCIGQKECPPLPPVTPNQYRGNGVNDQLPVYEQLRLTKFGSDPQFAPQLEDGMPSIKQAFGPVLVDGRGNYVFNEPRMNPAEVNQIISQGWYDADNLQDFNDDFEGNPFQLLCSEKDENGNYPKNNSPKVPCRDNGSKPNNNAMGAIEIKAAWMILPPEEYKLDDPNEHLPDRSKYYTTKRSLMVKTTKKEQKNKKYEQKKVTVDVALIGFHISHKTSHQGWIWSTFEHKYNAPGEGGTSPGRKHVKRGPLTCSEGQKAEGYYNLNSNPTCSVPENCRINKPANKPYLWRDKFPHAVTISKEGTIKEQKPSQIRRQVCIPQYAHKLNKKWQKKLEQQDSVFQNYELIGVQWLENPNLPYKLGSAQREPTNLINASLESFPQTQKYKNLSCASCHQTAKLPNKDIYSDFSFLINDAQFMKGKDSR